MRGRRPMLLLVGLLGTSLAVSVGLLPWPAPPLEAPRPLLAEPSPAGDREVSVAAVAPAGPEAAADIARLPAPDGASVVGRLRLATGEPLVGWRVQLRRSDRRPLPRGRLDLEGTGREVPAVDTVTGADGWFGFPALAAGNYQVVCLEQEWVVARFALAIGEQRVVDLMAKGAVVAGRLFRGGAPLPGTNLRFVGPQGTVYVRTDDSGWGRCLLSAGSYEVLVFGAERVMRPTAVHRMVVPANLASVAWEFDAGGVDLDVELRDELGGLPAQFVVRLDGETGSEGQAVEYTATGRAGRASFARVPPGRWCVTVSSPTLAPIAARAFVADNVVPRETMSFVAIPATTVGLVVQKAGRPFDVAAAAMPPLLSGEMSLPCEARHGTTKLVYRSVPAGPAVLRVEDRMQGGAIVFLPFDPLPAQTLDAVLGIEQQIMLDVVPRALVDLRACEGSGREDFTAVVSVFAGERAVRKHPEPKPYRWSAFLPPGDYRVVVERKGNGREHALRVDRANVSLRLRP